MKNILAASALLALLPAAGHCGAGAFGEILIAEPSVRANGMGDAYTAANGDIFGAYYNPAQYISAASMGAAFQRGYSEDSTGVIAFGKPEAVLGLNLSASLLYYNAGDIDLFSNSGAKSSVASERDYVGVFNASKHYGIYSIGANVKYAHTNLFEAAKDSTFAYDAGVLAQYPLASLGAAVQNMGASMKLGSQTEYVPVTWRVGAYRGFERKIIAVNLACDYVKTKDQPGYVRAGGELVYDRLLAFRTGYEFQNSLSDANKMRFGFGLLLKSMTLDYALVPYEELGATHRFSLSYKFDMPGQKIENAPVAVSATAPAPETVPAPAPKAAQQPPAAQAEPTPAAPLQAQQTPVAAVVATPASESAAMPNSELPLEPAAMPVAAPLVASASSATGLKLEQVIITDSVENREPGKDTASFAAGTRKVYCWMKVSGTTSETLKVVWYANGRRVSTAPVQIKFDPMRAWNYKTVVPGDWKVEIVDSNDAVLATKSFTVER